MRKTAAMMMGLVFVSTFAAQAEPPVITQQVTPGTMSYQGRLQTADGVDYTNGVYTIDFKLYETASDTNFLWGVTYKPYVNNGFFSVILGQTDVGEAEISGATYPAVEDFWKGVWIDPASPNKQRFLGITVHENQNGDEIVAPQESFPRQELLASPFAIQAQYAQQASGNFSVPGDLELTGAISNPDADLYVSDNLHVDGNLAVNGQKMVTIGAVGSLSGKIPAGEPESSDLLVGNDLYVDETMMAGLRIYTPAITSYDASLQIESGSEYIDMRGTTVCYGDLWVKPGYDLRMDSHVISHVVEAPRTGVRMVAGEVNAAGNEVRDIGGKFTSRRDGEGKYTITFTEPFSAPPVIVVSLSEDANSFENFISLNGTISAGSFHVEGRDDSPSEQANVQDTPFTFIAVGY